MQGIESDTENPRGLRYFFGFRIVLRKMRNPVKLDSDSGSKWTPVPDQTGRLWERSDAGVSL